MSTNNAVLKFKTRSGLLLQKITRNKGGVKYACKKWHLRVQHNGVRRFIPLDENPKSAEKKANDLMRILDGSNGQGLSIREALSQLEQEGLLAPIRTIAIRGGSTLGQLRDVVESNAANLDLTLFSAKEYVRSIFTMAREVVKVREGRKATPRSEEMLHYPLTILDDHMVYDFKGIRVPPSLERHTSESKSAKISANRHIRNAQALFSDDRIAFLRKKDLRVSSMASFRAVGVFKKTIQKYTLPSATLMITVANQISTELKALDTRLYCAALLGLHGGLRREEIIHAKWSWFLEDSDGLVLYVKPEKDFAPKFGRDRKVKVARWLQTELLKFKAGTGVYILPDYDSDKNAVIITGLVAWLRGHGVDAEKPIHELRKWFGSFFATEYSITVAQRQLGHSTPMVTNDHYAGINFKTALRLIWLSPEKLQAPISELLLLIERNSGAQSGIERDALGFPVKRFADPLIIRE